MSLHPSSLSVIQSLDEDQALQTAKSSPLMDPVVAKYLVGVLVAERTGAVSEKANLR